MPWIPIDRILEAHEAEPSERWPCRYCRMTFSERGLLEHHTETTHGKPNGRRRPTVFATPR